MTALPVALALAAAVAFGWSTALMHHSASAAPQALGGPLALLRHLVGQWRWLIGMVASFGGLALHAAALHFGSLALVQPLVVTGLVFSFVFRAALDRRLLPRAVTGWVLLTATGLAVFLVAFGETPAHRLDTVPAAAMFAAGSVAAAGAWWLSLKARPARCGLLLGVSGGVVFGLIAGALKATTVAASRGGLQLLTAWPLYVLVALGVTGFLLNQRAYHKAPLASSLPVLNMLNPVVAVTFGVVAFHERLTGNAVSIAAQAAGLAAVLTGVYVLSLHGEDDAASEPQPR